MPDEGTTKDENKMITPTPPLPPQRGRERVGGGLLTYNLWFGFWSYGV